MTDNDRIKIMARLMKLNDYEMDKLNKSKISIENYKKLIKEFGKESEPNEETKEILKKRNEYIQYLKETIKENERLIKVLEGEIWPD